MQRGPAPASTSAIPTTLTPPISTGTSSGPGATPYTTLSNGVVIYANNSCQNNIVSGNNNNQNACGPPAKSGSSLSKGDIAGVVIGVVSAVAGILGSCYAYKTFVRDKRESKKRVQWDPLELGPSSLESLPTPTILASFPQY